MSGTSFDPNSLLNVQYNVSNVAVDQGVLNGTDGNPTQITLTAGVYTINPNATLTGGGGFVPLAMNSSGGANSSEPEDQFNDTSIAFTYVNLHPTNTNPLPTDPLGLTGSGYTGFVDGTAQSGINYTLASEGFTVVGVAKGATGAVAAVLLEGWDSFSTINSQYITNPAGTGQFTLPGREVATDSKAFLILSNVDDFYTENMDHAVPVLKFDQVTSVTCFSAGTRIAAPGGEAAVEAMQPGDRVVTASGQVREVAWIGQRSIDCTRHPSPTSVWPVRVAAGAFAPGRPSRDLLLSPDHAVFAEGVLIPVRMLVNGSTIAQVERSKVSYFHVELETHDVLLAEGLPVESYLDTGNRDTFANAATVALHPRLERTAGNTLAWEAYGCAPLKVHGAEVDRLRLTLAAQAVALGRADEAGSRADEAAADRSLQGLEAAA
jgi:hypothetical protein